ncbi:MAG: DNA ligase D [Aquabacterium sp.]
MPTTARSSDPLQRYAAKRNFGVTPEPGAKRERTGKILRFVIQKHWASHLHYDFRLEHAGVLLSWAVPKGPSFDPQAKRMAVHVEDHPVSYGSFEGTIPPRQYGAGEVIVWDHGSWEPQGDVDAGLRQGKLVFRLHGQKLAGLWELVRISRQGDKRDNWLLFKKRDEWARPAAEFDVTTAWPDSVIRQPLGLLEVRAGQMTEQMTEQVNGQGAAPGKARTTHRAASATAPRAALPEALQPQLATLAKGLPSSGQWIYEFKFDGYRLLARIERGKARLFTRNGHDWTAKMPELAADIAALGLRSSWLDGEVVALGDDGLPDFNALQNAFDASHTSQLIWYAFDAPYLNGRDMRQLPLVQRRQALAQALQGHELAHVRLSEALDGAAADLWRSACSTGLEGLMAKRVDAPYVHSRSEDWLKIKCAQRQEFIVLGYTERSNGAGDFGSLLLGYHDADGRLQYAGNVGTGWNSHTRHELFERMRAIEVGQPPAGIDKPSRGRWSIRPQGVPHWLKPELVVEVSFGEWTPEGRIRHASFQGLRTDKPARQVNREEPVSIDRPAPARKKALQITHGDRVIDASSGLTKLDLVRYYESVAEHLLPHLKKRPVSLVRAPEGVDGEKFFQKHVDPRTIPHAHQLDPALWPGHDALAEIASVQALIEAAQMNVIEFHTWNASTRHMDKPDRLIFDLDPGEGVGWPEVQEAALLTRALLDELGLQCWLKTSGGKGLHVVVPIAPKLGWQEVKDFSRDVVAHLARTVPSRFVAKSGPKNRKGRIFADYLRNGEGQTTVAAFSVRARPGLGVSMPIDWAQLGEVPRSDAWTVANARDHLSFLKADPWAGYASCRQTLTQAIRRMAKVAQGV